jgi:hypothetical protein
VAAVCLVGAFVAAVALLVGGGGDTTPKASTPQTAPTVPTTSVSNAASNALQQFLTAKGNYLLSWAHGGAEVDESKQATAHNSAGMKADFATFSQQTRDFQNQLSLISFPEQFSADAKALIVATSNLAGAEDQASIAQDSDLNAAVTTVNQAGTAWNAAASVLQSELYQAANG